MYTSVPLIHHIYTCAHVHFDLFQNTDSRSDSSLSCNESIYIYRNISYVRLHVWKIFTTFIHDVCRDPGKPCCTTCTSTGDAAMGDSQPLQVMQPLFCTKIIHQSTPSNLFFLYFRCCLVMLFISFVFCSRPLILAISCCGYGCYEYLDLILHEESIWRKNRGLCCRCSPCRCVLL